MARTPAPASELRAENRAAPRSSFWKHTGVICFAAFALRLLWVLVAHNDPLVAEGGWYEARAQGLLAGQGYQYHGTPTAFFPIGEPAFLSAVHYVFGSGLLACEVATVCLSVASCLLLIFITQRLFDDRTALCAGWLFALHPNQIFFNSVLMSEPLFIALLLGVLALTVSPDWAERSGFGRRVLAGVVLGCCALVRPAGLLLLVAFWLRWKFSLRRSATQSSVLALGVLAGVGLILLPWVVRNIRTLGAPVLVSTNGGINVWIAQSHNTYEDPPAAFTANWMRPANFPGEEVQAERLAYHQAFQMLEARPLAPLLRWPQRTARYFYADIDALLLNSNSPSVRSPGQIRAVAEELPLPVSRPMKFGLYLLSEIYYLLLLFTAFAGFWQQRRNLTPQAQLLPLLFVLWWLVHTLIFFSSARFRMPMMPIMIVFSACFLTRQFGKADRFSS